MNIIQKIKHKLIRLQGQNIKFDRIVKTMSDEQICSLLNINIEVCNAKMDNFWNWLKNSKLDHFLHYSYPHKKALEFYFSSCLLQIKRDDIVLDAAGGQSGFLDAISNTYRVKKLILQDHIYNGAHSNDRILIVGGDITNIDLANESVDKIACHHAFEHFQGMKDIGFIGEIGRLLRSNGRAVIIPLFISTKYVECRNNMMNQVLNKDALQLIDLTSSLPGGNADGHFARVYDALSFDRRILSEAKKSNLVCNVIRCTLDSYDIPDMGLNKGAKINKPMRAFVLEKRLKH